MTTFLRLLKLITFIVSKLLLISFLVVVCNCNKQDKKEPHLNNQGYFETRGLNVLVFSNCYNESFDDSKMSSIEIIHHDMRVATNGDVRLNPTPEQWDPIPVFLGREIDSLNQVIEASLTYPAYNFKYRIKVKSEDKGVLITVNLDTPLPHELEGNAGFNLEFIPSSYIEKSYLMDDSITGIFPLYPGGPMEINQLGVTDPKPIAQGNILTLAPEDPEKKITITSQNSKLMLYDGRNKAQNGWFVVRSLIPVGKTGDVISWQLSANTLPNWIRPPVIGHSQVGYHPSQQKKVVIELDRFDKPLSKASLFKVSKEGPNIKVYKGKVDYWGNYLRYIYCIFDFSTVTEEGLYFIQYGNATTKPFRIAKDVFEKAWYPTLDIFMPVQMDHMFVNESYRVWHGASHLDDALQAPVNHKHFDLYTQGPTTDTRFKPGEHIPGLNIGGWFDAGDFDIRTQSQYGVVLNLVNTWENFKPERDETTIDQTNRFVSLHHPDGKPDILQQIEHGVLALIAQHRAVGYAINGIIESHLSQYTHLGDAVNKTDNLIYNPLLDSLERKGNYSGTFDDRWAFTSRSTALNYGSIAALAAASRALKGFNDKLANECLTTAIRSWHEEHSHKPFLFHYGNTTGGLLEEEELKAATELLITTSDLRYATRIKELWGTVEREFGRNAVVAVKALPYLDETYRQKLKELTIAYRDTMEKNKGLNPYEVPIWTGGWAGNGLVVYIGITNYWLHKTFPDIIDKETVLKTLNYIYGCHPGSDISFVSGVGTTSKKVAYGNNRADFSFIAGGIVPGVLILPPDFPENKEDWPFLWGENEYVITLGASYIFLVQAVNDMLSE
jgi:endoglucanase